MEKSERTGTGTDGVGDIALIEASLWLEGAAPPGDLAWLERSWREPAAFWKALHSQCERREPGVSKSAPLRHYDFYHDLVARRQAAGTTALAWFDGAAWRAWTHAELAQSAEGWAASWEKAGVEIGDTVAILYPPGPRWLSAFMAGLRLGLVVAVLPPWGPAFLERRLANLAPRWLAAEPLLLRGLSEGWRELALPDRPSATPPARRSHAYPGTAAAACCFDPCSPEPDLPRAVDADTLYLGALRDGVLALGLRPGQICAAPGWHPLESQPGLVLAALLSGAGWAEIDPAEVEKDPARLLERSIDVLGVTRGLRDLLLKRPPPGGKPWRHWFRHPAESSDLSLWQGFVERLGLGECYAGNLLCNAALGGALLFSVRRRGQAHPGVLPAAGACWQLGALASPELPGLGGTGRLALGRRGEKETVWTPTPYLLARNRGEWMYLGHYPQGRAGRTYPRQEILDLLADPGAYPALVEAPAAGGEGDALQVLLAFGEAVDIEALRARIARELGADFLPDRIERLPLLPKRDGEGRADPEWCRSHYLTGELYRRQRSPVYRCLSELKRRVLGIPAPFAAHGPPD
jgi:hypothetical protein